MFIKFPWQEVAVAVEEVYGTWSQFSQDYDDSFFICPHCDEPICKRDYPDIVSEVDKTTMHASFPKCPVCGEEYEIQMG